MRALSWPESRAGVPASRSRNSSAVSARSAADEFREIVLRRSLQLAQHRTEKVRRVMAPVADPAIVSGTRNAPTVRHRTRRISANKSQLREPLIERVENHIHGRCHRKSQVAAVGIGDDGTIPTCQRAAQQLRIAVLLPVPVVPRNLKCLVSSLAAIATPASARSLVSADPAVRFGCASRATTAPR